MIVASIEQICPDQQEWLEQCELLVKAESLAAIVWVAMQMGLWIARGIVEAELRRRAKVIVEWSKCQQCGHKLQSKGWRERQIETVIGKINWNRRVGRCPKGCRGSLTVPLDEALGIKPNQSSSEELMRLGCLLSVVMPYELASWLLGQWSGLSVSSSTLWNWVQTKGRQAQAELELQLKSQAQGQVVKPDSLSAILAALPLAIAADGVMVPFRPVANTPKGKTQWQEIKIALLTRLGSRINRAGATVPQLLNRRLVAVLGDIDKFIPHIQLEARRQAFESASQVVWLSDGGRGFWRVYHTCFAHCTVAVLDFYHAAGHLWRATAAIFQSPRSADARAWFVRWRHQLRHGQDALVLTSLTRLINTELFAGNSLATLLQVQAYFQRHHHHIRYQHFEQLQLPLGSGMIESACKWLIQQRFKGVGMRWSESGFNHLLILRVAWVNQRFDSLFPLVTLPVQPHSPIP
jgi:hypothetical protein